jgi:hypothetical protein
MGLHSKLRFAPDEIFTLGVKAGVEPLALFDAPAERARGGRSARAGG